MRIAFAGLATCRPFADALALPDDTGIVLWEPDPDRRAHFLRQHPKAAVADTLEELLAADPGGVILTVPTPDVPDALGGVLDRDLPCLVTKPAAATSLQVLELDRVVAKAPQRVLSSSVLRFAPIVARAIIPRSELTAVRVTVRHDVGLWATGYNPWQDDPALGGGTLAMMGVHGVELLVTLFGPDVRLLSAAATTRHYIGLQSEDTCLLTLRWADGLLGVVEVIGVADSESYEVVMQAQSGPQCLSLDGGSIDADLVLGNAATIAAFLRMVAGAPSPVPWSHTRAVLDIIAAARASIRGIAPDSVATAVKNQFVSSRGR